MKRAGTQPTMKDVARVAGVSLGTVSKVMNQIPVGEAYRKRVEDASKQLGYEINSYARGLKTNQTYCVALILPSLRHPYFASLADDVTASLMRHGYRTMLMITNYDREAEQKCITMVRQNKVDGIIALTYNPQLRVDEDLPYVSIDRHVNPHVPCVTSDNYGGGQMAAEKLIELGCRKLLFLRIGSDVAGEPDKRGVGFENVCHRHGIPFESRIVNDSDTELPLMQYIETHCPQGQPDFDGIFCNTDRLAVHILEKLTALHVAVPAQVQIIGYDGVIDYATGRHHCSTIMQPVQQIAETAVNILLSPDRSALPALVSLPVLYSPGGTTRDTA